LELLSLIRGWRDVKEEKEKNRFLSFPVKGERATTTKLSKEDDRHKTREKKQSPQN